MSGERIPQAVECKECKSVHHMHGILLHDAHQKYSLVAMEPPSVYKCKEKWGFSIPLYEKDLKELNKFFWWGEIRENIA